MTPRQRPRCPNRLAAKRRLSDRARHQHRHGAVERHRLLHHRHHRGDVACARHDQNRHRRAAAEALRPLAGPLAFLLFSVGIIGTGLLAVPVLAGSAAYAVAESFGWEGSLEMPARGAPGFYLIVAAATLAGLGAASPARSDPDAVLERRRQRHRRRAADGRHDGGGGQPQDHGQIRRVALRWSISGWRATALMAVVVAALLAPALALRRD